MKRAVIPVIIFCAVSLLPWPGRGQPVFPGLPALTPGYVNNFSTERDLPQPCFSDVLLDHKERLWAATCPVMAGINSVRLFQFDGYDFYPANLANDQLPSRTLAILKCCLSGGEILGMFESRTANALVLFNPDRQTSRTLTFDIEREGHIRDLSPQADGSIIVLLEKPDSLMLYRIRSLQYKEQIIAWVKPPSAPEGRGSSFGLSLFVSGDEALVAGNDPPALFQIRLRERTCRRYPLDNWPALPVASGGPAPSSNDQFYQAFVPTPRGELICFIPQLQHQVFIRRAGGDAFEPMQGLPGGYAVHRLESDSSGNILFLLKDRQQHNAGILLDAGGRQYDYSAFVAGHHLIHNLHSTNFFKSVFICADDGLSYHTTREKNMIRCLLPGYSIRGMTELEPGRFYISSENRPAVVYEAASGQILSGAAISNVLRAFGGGLVRNFQRAPDGSIWGNRSDTLVQYFPASGQHRDYPVFGQFFYQTLLSDGRIAVLGKDRGLEFYDPVANRRTAWQGKIDLGAQGPFIHNMQQTKDGLLWILTTSGLLRLDLQSGEESLLGFGQAFHDFRFVCMTQTADGKLWLGTFLGGIQIYDPKTGSVQVVDRAQGLPSNTVVLLVQDATGDVWAGTYQGLSRLSPDGTLKNNYLLGEGLCELEFNRYAGLRARDGTLLMGTLRGLHIIHPPGQPAEQSGLTNHAPQIYLTALAIIDPQTGAERKFQEDLDSLPLIVLPPERRYLHLSFALSSYAQPGRNQFAYMLEGKDKTWTSIGVRHDLTLNDLPAGHYTLLLKGCDFEGNWTVTPVRIVIQGREFFYKQPWFYILCLLPFLFFGWMWLQRLRSEKKRLEKEVQKRTRQIQKDKALIEQQAHELLQLDEVKSRFFTNISHELRTPITLITAPVEKMLQKYTGSTETELRQSLQWVLYNGRNLSALVEELLELSRLEAGKSELQESPTELQPYCRQIFSAFESQAQIKRIRYTLQYEAREQRRLGLDRRRLEKIINNLISNALKFTPADGSIQMTVQTTALADQEKSLVTIRVQDSGRGIPPEDLPHVFERYFQTKRQDIAREGGTGIGLALAKELATLMKGELRVESEWGKGCTFTLLLPVHALSEAAAPLPENTLVPALHRLPDLSTQEQPAAGARHILIVEDNPDMRALLQSLLFEEYAITLAKDGQEAWEMLEAGKENLQDLSLILSDVMMPRMDGYELLGKIKSHAQWQQLPVILLTARAEEQDKLQALRLGVDDYLVKPFSPPELLARLSNLIGNYRRRQHFSGKASPDIRFEKVDSHAATWLKAIETAAKTALDKGLPLQAAYLADAGAMSERQFFREIKRATGLTPNQYILEVRLQKARHLLQHRAYPTLAEVAYAVGFDTPGYFTKVFEQHFGKHPSAYLSQMAVVGKVLGAG